MHQSGLRLEGETRMLEDLYAKPDLSRKARAQPQEMERVTTADDEDRNEPIYDNNVVHRSTEDIVEEHQKATSVHGGSGTGVKVVLGLLWFILLAAVVVMVALLIEWRRDNSKQQEELLRSLGEMRGNLSQLSSYNQHLMDNYSYLATTVELHHTEIEDVASNLIAAMQNLTRKCPDGWTPFQSSCYLLSDSPRNWLDSRRFCQGHEADLVVVSDITKQLFIMSFEETVWIGVTGIKGIYTGVDKQNVTKTFWNPGEPNNSLFIENCVELQKLDSVKNWNDHECNVRNYCVCEKKMK